MAEEKKQGRPTLYKEEYNEQAYKLCLLGATDKEIGYFFNVDERTINNWKIDFPLFFQSIKRGKIIADANVAESLYKLAVGHTVKEVTYEKIDSGIGLESDDLEADVNDIWKKKTVVKEISPNATAGIFWEKNRQPDKWRDKQEVKLDGDININWEESKTYEAK